MYLLSRGNMKLPEYLSNQTLGYHYKNRLAGLQLPENTPNVNVKEKGMTINALSGGPIPL